MSEGTVPPAEPVAGLRRIPFSARDEADIKGLAGWMTIAGIIGLIAGLLGAFGNLIGKNPGNVIGSILDILVSVWIIRGASAFGKVATTDTADQANLLTGFKMLRLVFLLNAIRVIVGLVIIVAAMVIGLLVALSQAARG